MAPRVSTAVWLLAVAVVVLATLSAAEPQRQNNRFNNNNRRPNNNNRFVPPNTNRFNPNNNNNNRRPVNNQNNRQNRQQQNVRRPAPAPAPAFRATPANARDSTGNEVYPGCNGTVCLPIAQQCAVRQQKSGHFAFQGKSYWVSWASSEAALRNARWNWFTGRNYCRKMCMDMVSFETAQEQTFIHNLMTASNIDNVHTAGRLCDGEVEGCDQPRFQPLHINGWFWASTLKMMPPTNQASRAQPGLFNNWSHTGSNGGQQPDGTLKADGWGNEACMALLDNKYNDGLKWHDEPCNTRRVLVCEDLPTPNINFVRNQNPGVRIP